MLAPCITVLSTSKNAATSGSAGVARASSTSAADAAASPASVDRRWRSSRRRCGHAAGATEAVRFPGEPRTPVEPWIGCPWTASAPTSAARLEPTRSPTWWRCAAARDGDRDGRSWRPRDARLTWADLDDEVGRVATGLGDAGMVAGPPGDARAWATGSSSSTTYLGALRAQLVAVPVNPRAKVEELAWMIADSGARLVVADSATVAEVRAAGVLVREALAGSPRRARRRRGRARPRAPAGRRRRRARSPPTSSPSTTCAPPRPRPLPHPPRPRDPGRACSTPAAPSTCPRAAMLTHRALLANIEQAAAVRPADDRTADDVVLGVLPLFHVYGLNAVLGGVLRQGATLVLVDRFDPRGTLDLIADARRARWCPWRRRCSRTGSRSDDLATALAGVRLVAVRLGAAGAGRDRGVHRAHRHPGPPGLRPDRGRPGRDQHARVSRRRCPARSAPRCPASGSGWSTTTAWSPRAGPRRDRDPRRQPVQRLLARRRRRPRTPRAGGPPATSASSTTAATCSWSTGSRSWSSSPASTSTRARSRR